MECPLVHFLFGVVDFFEVVPSSFVLALSSAFSLIWTNYFLQAQGHKYKAVLYQDNQSAMLLEKNGTASLGRRTRHIDIRYFMIKDRVDKKELSLEYCPTDEMIADFLTKPLQGEKFRKFRKLIMNLDHDS